ncbi:hypothetical protein JQ616_39020 [Bradyrhizobium tropiciagri]|uniref:hypothetical protein n=1 Tax=Bradyrhizobium tropiciagri TaxID=312253 RepID=UPI001BA87DF0|nr:hypothetical protein [Bradyrhizobium tropiciagri]MBR0900985.1 hypothetical protein [Bradyrhizobium tropiciagri]
MATTVFNRNLCAVQFDPLFEVPELPPNWNGPHVGTRITEGFATLRLMPGGVCMGLRSAWPQYAYEFSDLIAQQEQGELERTMAIQNRTLITPSAREVEHALNATYWPVKYLHVVKPELCKSVNAVALAHALERDAAWVARVRGGYADTWRERHDRGCEIIAVGLAADRLPVF